MSKKKRTEKRHFQCQNNQYSSSRYIYGIGHLHFNDNDDYDDGHQIS